MIFQIFVATKTTGQGLLWSGLVFNSLYILAVFSSHFYQCLPQSLTIWLDLYPGFYWGLVYTAVQFYHPECEFLLTGCTVFINTSDDLAFSSSHHFIFGLDLLSMTESPEPFGNPIPVIFSNHRAQATKNNNRFWEIRQTHYQCRESHLMMVIMEMYLLTIFWIALFVNITMDEDVVAFTECTFLPALQ